MDQAAADVAIKACLREIRDRATEVGAASDIALLCADIGLSRGGSTPFGS